MVLLNGTCLGRLVHLDSNVLTGGIVASWGLDKAVLSLCTARTCRLVLAEIIRQEVEDNLL
jgi:predicted nucleic acid-binding protein